jgi:hypothetical protein
LKKLPKNNKLNKIAKKNISILGDSSYAKNENKSRRRKAI